MADDHWRNTSNEVKFLFLDAKAFLPFPVLLLVKSLIILSFGLIFLVFFFILNKKGLSFTNWCRRMRIVITGPVKEIRKTN